MFGFGKSKGLEALRRHAHEQRRLPKGQQLTPWSAAEELVYTINPVYLETTQGGASPMRGWGAVIFLAMLISAVWFSIDAVTYVLDLWKAGAYSRNEVSVLSGITLCSVAIFVLALCVVPALWLYLSFFSVTDLIVRFDRKRCKAWMWTGGGPIEMPWSELTPVVAGMAASAQLPGRTYRGLYAEFDDQGQYRTTRGIPHVIQVGQVSAAEDGVKPALEFVRVYMERGLEALPQPNRLLRHRPRWYAMVNFLGLADDWALHLAGGPNAPGRPWWRTAAFIMFFPLLFPMQFTNWLALRVAPLPKWPREILDMHEADLRDLAAKQAQVETKTQPRRKPVIRVNGELIDPPNE